MQGAVIVPNEGVHEVERIPAIDASRKCRYIRPVGMCIDRSSPLPRHFQLGEAIKREIIERGLCTGDPIPSERALSEEYNVSRVTVRRTIADLVEEGILRREGRRGTFVKDLSRISVWQNTARRRLWGMVIPDIEDFFATRLVSGVDRQVQELGFGIALGRSDEEPEMATRQLDRLMAELVAGIILIPVACDDYEETNLRIIERLRSQNVPVVLVDRYVEGSGIDAVVSDNFDGGYKTTKHLIELGHRRIAFIGYPRCSTVTDRIAGYKKCLMDNGILPDSRLVIQPHPRRDREATIELTRRLMEMNPRPTAIFTANDGIAMDVWTGLREMGLRVPEDVSLAGYDNAAGLIGGDALLTTTEQPLPELSSLASRMLAERIDGYEGEPRLAVLKSTFIQGRSTAPPPAN